MKRIIFLINLILLSLSSNVCQAQWQKTSGPTGGSILSLAVNGNDIFAGTYGNGVYLSLNNGEIWSQNNNGLNNRNVNAMAVRGNKIYAGTDAGLYYTSNNGGLWKMVKKGKIYQAPVYSFTVVGTKIYAGTGIGVFLSTGNDTIWNSLGLTYNSFNALALNGRNLIAGSYRDGIFYTEDNGAKWDPMNSGLTNTNIVSLAVCGTNIFAGTNSGGICLSTDSAKSWKAVNNGLPFDNEHNIYYTIKALVVKGQDIFAGIWGKGVYMSNDNGANWIAINEGFTDTNPAVESLILNKDSSTIYAGITNVWKKDILTTSIKESITVDNTTKLSIFPNPVKDYLFIENKSNNIVSYNLSVKNILGQEVLSENAEIADTYKLDLSKLTKGIYLLRITNSNNSILKKLLIQ